MRTPLTAITLAITASTAVGSVTHDAAADFSSSSNPNGVWSYAYAATATGTTTLLSQSQQRFEPALMPGWARTSDPTSSALPAVFHNSSGGAVPVIDYPAPVEPGALIVHPGDLADEDFVVVRFTAAVGGLYDASASFEALDTTLGIQALVVVNQSATLYDNTISGVGSIASFSTSSSIALSAGDTIDFIVGNAGNYTNDSVQLDATVTLVPAPGALGLATGALVVARRRRR